MSIKTMWVISEGTGILRTQRKSKSLWKWLKKTRDKLNPINTELMEIVDSENWETTKILMVDKFQRETGRVLATQWKHKWLIAIMIQDWQDGGHWYIMKKKPDGIFWTLWENWNSTIRFCKALTRWNRHAHSIYLHRPMGATMSSGPALYYQSIYVALQ